jgi:hypothetical protein
VPSMVTRPTAFCFPKPRFTSAAAYATRPLSELNRRPPTMSEGVPSLPSTTTMNLSRRRPTYAMRRLSGLKIQYTMPSNSAGWGSPSTTSVHFFAGFALNAIRFPSALNRSEPTSE